VKNKKSGCYPLGIGVVPSCVAYAAMLRFVFGVVSCLGAFGVMGVVCLAPVGMKFGELVVR
jgi:hypothetical protein